MATRKPLVIVDGQVTQLPEGDEIEMSVPIGHGVFLWGTEVKEQIIGTKRFLLSGRVVSAAPLEYSMDIIFPQIQDSNAPAIVLPVRTNPEMPSGQLHYYIIGDVVAHSSFDGAIKKTIPIPGGRDFQILSAATFEHFVVCIYFDYLAPSANPIRLMWFDFREQTLQFFTPFPNFLAEQKITYYPDVSGFVVLGYELVGTTKTPVLYETTGEIRNTCTAFDSTYSTTACSGFIIDTSGNLVAYWIVYEGTGSSQQIALYHCPVPNEPDVSPLTLTRIQLSSGTYDGKGIKGDQANRIDNRACFLERTAANTARLHWIDGESVTPTQSAAPALRGITTERAWQTIQHINDGHATLPLFVLITYEASTLLWALKEFGDTGTWIDLIALIPDYAHSITYVPSAEHLYFSYIHAETGNTMLARYNTDPLVAGIDVIYDVTNLELPYVITQPENITYVQTSGDFTGINVQRVDPATYAISNDLIMLDVVGSAHYTPNLYFRIE